MRCWNYLSICLLLFCGCFGSKAPQGQTNMPRKATYFDNNGLTLKSSTSQDSVSKANRQKIINYVFKISIVTKEIVSFDTVWIGQKPLHVYVAEANNVKSKELKIPLGSTLTLEGNDNNATQIDATSRAPVAYQGKALIRYVISGVAYYLVANEINHVAVSSKP